MSLATASVLVSLNFSDTVVFEALLPFGAIVLAPCVCFLCYTWNQTFVRKTVFFFFKTNMLCLFKPCLFNDDTVVQDALVGQEQRL